MRNTVSARLFSVVATGDTHTAALRRDGTVRAWGHNLDGQTDVPANLGACSAIAVGEVHTVALRTDGTVRAWGANYYDYGQTNVPVDLGACSAIAAGDVHTVSRDVIPRNGWTSKRAQVSKRSARSRFCRSF